MALLNKTSKFVSPAELSIFSIVPTDPTIQSMDECAHYPISIIDNGGEIIFLITGNAEEYIKLSHTFLTFAVRILQGNGKPITADHKVGPVNNFAHSVWRSVSVEWGGQIVSSSVEYPYRAYKSNTFNYGNDAKNSHLSCALYEKDTAGQMDDIPGKDNKNEGLKTRAEYLAAGRIVYFRIHLDCDVFNIDKLLPNLVSIKVTLHRSKPSFCLMAGPHSVVPTGGGDPVESPANYKVDIIKPILWVTKVRLLPSVLIGQAKAIETETAKYKITRVLTRNYTLTAGVMSHCIDNAFNGQLPKRIIYGFVANEAFMGDYSRNPFNFQHANVTQTAIYVNGKCTPSVPFQPNYTDENGNCVREYHSLFDAMGIRYGNRGFDIHRNDYPKGYCLYAVDMTQNRGASDGSHVNLIQQGTVRIDFQFSIPLPEAMTCVVHAEFDSLIQVDHDRNIIINYAGSK